MRGSSIIVANSVFIIVAVVRVRVRGSFLACWKQSTAKWTQDVVHVPPTFQYPFGTLGERSRKPLRERTHRSALARSLPLRAPVSAGGVGVGARSVDGGVGASDNRPPNPETRDRIARASAAAARAAEAAHRHSRCTLLPQWGTRVGGGVRGTRDPRSNPHPAHRTRPRDRAPDVSLVPLHCSF